jgi:aspartokinase-like uncharacterized kinase
MFTRVIKVGGSLFDLADLGERLQHWLDGQRRARNFFVAGGGRLVDEIRQQHDLRRLDEFRAHWLCIDAMDIMAHVLHQRLVGSNLCSKISGAREARTTNTIFKLGKWLRFGESISPGTRLVESWDVTSDTIAARLAICVGADEFVLLKSADPPSHDLHQLAEVGYVDRFLPNLADELPSWGMVNLRNS